MKRRRRRGQVRRQRRLGTYMPTDPRMRCGVRACCEPQGFPSSRYGNDPGSASRGKRTARKVRMARHYPANSEHALRRTFRPARAMNALRRDRGVVPLVILCVMSSRATRPTPGTSNLRRRSSASASGVGLTLSGMIEPARYRSRTAGRCVSDHQLTLRSCPQPTARPAGTHIARLTVHARAVAPVQARERLRRPEQGKESLIS